jgi:hypothetical protein
MGRRAGRLLKRHFQAASSFMLFLQSTSQIAAWLKASQRLSSGGRTNAGHILVRRGVVAQAPHSGVTKSS